MTGAERMLAAARRGPVDRTPVWFMRQAGRCLASYRELREKYDILTLTRTPELCAQVTLMPVEQFGVDAAVMYADIMLPLYGMGVPFSIDPGVGPIIEHPIRDRAAVEGLRIVDPHEGTPELFETIATVRETLEGKTALIGFAGGPFTVAAYLVEGKPSKDHAVVKSFMYAEPVLWAKLMETLTEVTKRYLRAQVLAGAQMIQLFDSWAGSLSQDAYRKFVLPYSSEIFSALADMEVPRIHFGAGAAHLLEQMAGVDCEVVSVDWRLRLDQAWERIGENRAIQGNLEPAIACASWPVIEEAVRDVLDAAGGRPGHIFNLGHGVLAQTPSENLTRIVELVHSATERGS
jgi:uroporphyrinogen decarboxylase